MFDGAGVRLIAKYSTKVEKPLGLKWGFFVFESLNDGDAPVYLIKMSVCHRHCFTEEIAIAQMKSYLILNPYMGFIINISDVLRCSFYQSPYSCLLFR